MKPRSPRGYRAKGNQGERQAKALLEAWGYTVLNGAMAEPGCDLILNPKAAVEVKNRSWASIGGVERATLLVAAEALRKRGVAHWCLLHEDAGWFLCSIGRKPDGRVGLVLKQPIKAAPYPLGDRAPGGSDALELFAESGAVASNPGAAAPPAMPSDREGMCDRVTGVRRDCERHEGHYGPCGKPDPNGGD